MIQSFMTWLHKTFSQKTHLIQCTEQTYFGDDSGPNYKRHLAVGPLINLLQKLEDVY